MTLHRCRSLAELWAGRNNPNSQTFCPVPNCAGCYSDWLPQIHRPNTWVKLMYQTILANRRGRCGRCGYQNVVKEKELSLFDTLSADLPKQTFANQDTSRNEQDLQRATYITLTVSSDQSTIQWHSNLSLSSHTHTHTHRYKTHISYTYCSPSKLVLYLHYLLNIEIRLGKGSFSLKRLIGRSINHNATPNTTILLGRSS